MAREEDLLDEISSTRSPRARDPPYGYPAIEQDGLFSPSRTHAKLPGTGATKDENCGVWTSLAVCSGDPQHFRKPVTKNCGRLECPECHTRPLRRSANAAALRIDGYRHAMVGQRTLSGEHTDVVSLAPRHFLISFTRSDVETTVARAEKALTRKWGRSWTQDDWDRAVITKLRDRAYDLIDLAFEDPDRPGQWGAAPIIHPYRIRKSKRAKIQREINKLPNPIKYWQWIRMQPDWRDYVKFSPHVHLVAYGSAIPTNEFYERTGGAVIKMIRDVDNTPALVYYLLSHAPVINGKLQITYLGCLSRERLKVEKEWIDREDVLCPKCSAVMCWTRTDDQLNVLEVLYDRPMQHKHLHRVFRVVVPGGGPPG